MSDIAEPPHPLPPEIPRAPYSEIQALAARLIEWADFSVFGPLLDALREAGRHEDAREVARMLPLHGRPYRYYFLNRIRRDLLRIFIEDLFDVRTFAASIGFVDEELDPEMGEDVDGPPMEEPASFSDVTSNPPFGWTVIRTSNEPILTDGVQTAQRLTVTLERVHGFAPAGTVADDTKTTPE